jgi:DivIVA domain-containing protein
MPLTPADVHNVAFKKPSIGKRGYDEDEVDAFLDVVEAELTRLIEENASLTGGEDGGVPAAPRTMAAEPVADGEPVPSQAARLLTLAQETADKLSAEAREEVDRLLTDARERSEAMVSEAEARAAALDESTAARAAEADAQAKARAEETLTALERDRERLQATITELRAYEKEYRSRLKSWITEQLGALDAVGSQPATDGASATGAAKSGTVVAGE